MNKPVRQERIRQLVELLTDGSTIADACRACGVPSTTFYYLKRKHPELAVERTQIIVNRLIETIRENPSWNNQEICDACSVNITSFYKYMRKHTALREIRTITLEQRRRLPHFDSTYAEMLYKAGYSIRKIKSIMGSRAAHTREGVIFNNDTE